MVAIIAEIGRRSSFAAAILASLHVTTVLALLWLYYDTGDAARVADVSYKTFWLIIPSLIFFILLPYLIKQNIHIALAMMISALATAIGFFAFVRILKIAGVF